MLCFSLLVLASGAVVRTDANAESVMEDSADSVAEEDTEIQEMLEKVKAMVQDPAKLQELGRSIKAVMADPDFQADVHAAYSPQGQVSFAEVAAWGPDVVDSLEAAAKVRIAEEVEELELALHEQLKEEVEDPEVRAELEQKAKVQLAAEVEELEAALEQKIDEEASGESSFLEGAEQAAQVLPLLAQLLPEAAGHAAPAPPSRTVLMQQALVQSISDMLVKDELK